MRETLILLATRHGASVIEGLRVDSYNLPLRDDEGFVGDHARCKAFADALEALRWESRRTLGRDPLSGVRSDDRKAVDEVHRDGDPEAVRLIGEAVEIFAARLAAVAARFLETEEWSDTRYIIVGGGLRETGIGETVIRRANDLFVERGIGASLRPIHGDPDEAALLGAARLCPLEMRAHHEAVLTVDIGGSSIRASVVLLNQGVARDLTKSEVLIREHWRHCMEPVGRDEAVARLNAMLSKLLGQATEAGLTVAPFVGVGCPGQIGPDGSILDGGQNLPGDWEEDGFNLPARIAAAHPEVGGGRTTVILHNDAVIQGLHELPNMLHVERWGILTVGTGLGNARFANAMSHVRLPPQ